MSATIDAILNPCSVAIIGASADPGKRGYRAIQTLLAEGYTGRIIPINPRETEILGLPCFPGLDQAPGPIDVALVYTPAKTLPDVVEQCGRNGVKGAVVIAGGFSEVDEAGRILEEQMVAVARRLNVRVVGPNINGIFGARHNFNAIGWYDIPHGGISVLSNSSNIALSVVVDGQARTTAVGFSTIMSVGNQADLQFHEYVRTLGEDPGTNVIVSYVEGFKQGRAYFDAAREVALKKPIVVYKAGRNTEGVRLAKSHSGSLAGDYTVTSSVLKQAGVVLTDRCDALFPLAEALSTLPAMKGRRVAVVSEGGGPITIAAEALAELGLEVPPLTAESQRRIKEFMPTSFAVANPVDVGAGTMPSAANYGRSARVILEDPSIDALLFVGYFGGYTLRHARSLEKDGGPGQAAHENEYCAELCELMKQTGKPVVVQSHYADSQPEGLETLRRGGVPVHRSIEMAVACLAAAADYADARRRIAAATAPRSMPRSPVAEQLITTCRNQGRDALLEHEARDLLAACGLPLAPHAVVGDKSALDQLPAKLKKGPVAMKIVSRDILHKSEAGGVVLNVKGKAALGKAYDTLLENARAYNPDAHIEGVLVTPMAIKGMEVIVGATRDAQFGPVLMLGLGGIFVEVVKDVAIRALPVTKEDAHDMIASLKCRQMFDGVRGMPPVDKAALAELLQSVSALLTAHPEIVELDLNPVILNAAGYTIADARMIIATT